MDKLGVLTASESTEGSRVGTVAEDIWPAALRTRKGIESELWVELYIFKGAI
jgi:hypothetical protein